MRVQVESVEQEGTVGVGIGTDEEGRTVTFGGDWRPMMAVAEALAEGRRCFADVEDWQVLQIHDPAQ